MNTEFRTLVLHFFKRFFDRDSRAAESDAYTGIIQMLALLAMPGILLSTAMNNPSGRNALTLMWDRVGDHYVFIVLGMVVMGLLMTFKWDSLFPDRRDYLILSPLPISIGRMFAAKVVALSAFFLLFTFAINFASMIIIPLRHPNPLHSWSWLIDSFEAHAMAVLGASLFTALTFAALQGVLINVLTPTAFRRITPRIQMLSITVLVVTFLTLPLFKQGIRPLSERYPDVLSYFPFIWFLGLYEAFLPGSTLLPMAFSWARMAIAAMAVVASICAVAYWIGYRRYSKKLLESVDSDAVEPSLWQRLTSPILNRTLLKDPFQRAIFNFIDEIAGRSAKHRNITAMYTGAGIALAISFTFILDPRIRSAFPFRLSPAGSLEGPIMLSFIIVSGLRATFNVPYELNANWIFQITSGRSADYLQAVRKWVFLCRILPLYAVIAIFEFTYFSPATALAHLTFDLLLSAVLIELFFLSFNKVPFTCSYPRDKFRLAAVAVGYLYGFMTYAAFMGVLKRWASTSPERLAVYVVIASSLLTLVSIYRRSARIVYHDNSDSSTPLSIAGDEGYWSVRVREES